MKKVLKVVLWSVLALVALVLLLVATLPLWLGTIARPGVNALAPSFTKTSFNIGHLSLNPYTGRFELGDLLVGNPTGYSEPVAVSVSNLIVDIDMSTVGTSVIHVEEIIVNGVFLSYLHGGENKVDNVTQIQYNLAGGKEKYEAEQAAAAAEVKDEKETSQTFKEMKERFVIDRLTLSGIRLKYEFLVVSVPSITLTDLGKDSGGLTAVELGLKIWEAILKSVSQTGDGLSALGGLINTNAGKLGEAVKGIDLEQAGKIGESIKRLDFKGTGDSAVKDMKKAAKSVGDLFKFK